jgi:hypothetical protein
MGNKLVQKFPISPILAEKDVETKRRRIKPIEGGWMFENS